MNGELDISIVSGEVQELRRYKMVEYIYKEGYVPIRGEVHPATLYKEETLEETARMARKAAIGIRTFELIAGTVLVGENLIQISERVNVSGVGYIDARAFYLEVDGISQKRSKKIIVDRHGGIHESQEGDVLIYTGRDQAPR